MATLPRAIDYVTTALDELKLKLGPSVDTREGSRWDALMGGIAQAFIRAQAIVVQQFDAHVLDRATGDDLDLYCKPRGPVRRLPPGKSRGYMQFDRATAVGGAGSIPVGTEVRVPFGGKSYIFTVRDASPVAAGQLSISATVDAQQAGAESNVGAVSAGLALTGNPAPLFDTTLRPSSIFVSGGTAQETDSELRERQRLWEQSRQRATVAAVQYGALTANGVKHVVAAQHYDDHLGGRGVVYAADRDWNSSQPLLDDAAFALESWRALGPSLPVRPTTSVDVTVTATIQMARPVAFYNQSALRAAAVAKALEYFDARVDPYSYNLASLAGRIERAHDEITSVTLVEPTSGVASPLSPSAIALTGAFPTTLTRYRTTAALVTISIVGPS